jgi:hypothetical protein
MNSGRTSVPWSREKGGKTPPAATRKAQDNEPIFYGQAPESFRLGPVIPIALVLQQRAGLSYFNDSALG